ncbi:MAG: hypothetical protein LBL46_01665 [Rickettsiales bacterium]|jgi:hypothetical protein|nr:hypothetical protein [Rickettsiales bacterium]
MKIENKRIRECKRFAFAENKRMGAFARVVFHSLILLFSYSLFIASAPAFQMQSQRELGKGEAKNQNVIVKCTTPAGKVSDQSCNIRRFAKCNQKGDCNGWHPWFDLRSPGKTYGDWRTAAADCCGKKGLR